jgi:nucleotidyltransferase substrate binding protein (TIGR01987 family)
MTDYGKFESALKHLQLQLENYRTLDGSLPVLMREAVAESVIQRFETCYDCLWKVLKRHLSEELGLPDVPQSPKPVLRLAGDNGLLGSAVPRWIEYADARIGTSHDYSGEKARSSLALMSDFVNDAIALHRTLTGKAWE